MGILYPTINVVHCSTLIQNANASCVTVTNLYAHMCLNVQQLSVSFCFYKKLTMIRNDYDRVEEVFEVNIQLLMQSRKSTTHFINIDPIVLKLCCVE